METKDILDWRYALRVGLLAGVVVVYAAAIGMVETFSERSIIAGILTLGQLLVYGPALAAGYLVAGRRGNGQAGAARRVLYGALAGLVSSLPIIALILLAVAWPSIRTMFVSISPPLIKILTLGLGTATGSLVMAGILAGLALLGAVIRLLPDRLRGAIIPSIAVVIICGLLGELINQIVRDLFSNTAARAILVGGALRPLTAAVLFVASAALAYFWAAGSLRIRRRYAALNTPGRRAVQGTGFTVLGLILLVLPWVLGTYLSEVMNNVGLYILMALGLNMAVGLAGLLDLGYVANFAIGAYVMGLLTSTGNLGIAQMNFWLALPIAIVAAMISSSILALPVLRMRGDYLAITTLGFGEIIRLIVLSDWLKPWVGGAQGVLQIPKASIGPLVLGTPEMIYYMLLAASLLVLFVSVRLDNSRIGRQWMAMREDEDAAKSAGIDTMMTKLLAFALSAASGGLAGAIFAAKLGTIFPHSFSLLISINALAVIIVGGMGSIPGIIVGALVLVGLPELLREFAEYRLLLYGILLVIMMLKRPEGLWPSATRRRELRAQPDITPAGG
jgi:branched-chain amino acid transport system permease protein